jgi:hypothetical protein
MKGDWMMMLLHGARIYVAAMALATVAFTSTASAQPQVRVGKTYEGYWTTGEKVMYRINSSHPTQAVYYGTMRFESNGAVENCVISYKTDGTTLVERRLFGGGRQYFRAGPRTFELPNGRTYYEYRGGLVGRGVGSAANEIGCLWVWKN